MMLNVQHKVNWELIRKRKQQIIHKNNVQENSKRIPHTYQVGDQVWLAKGNEYKYEAPSSGPHTILKVYKNGTVRMQVKSVTDTYNIRRLAPYVEPDTSNHGGECSMRMSRKRRKLKR